MLAPPRPAAAQAVRGEASVSTTGGYGRLVIRLTSEVDSNVRLSGNVLVIQFKHPIDVPVDRITAGATDYIGAARRDPDGRALRFALARKVKVSSMTAGERLFVDLMPESWTGEPPGLPREVVEELAQRARDAERLARQKIELERQRNMPPVRVRVASQPTFTRYIFELPELTAVTAERGKDMLKLSFSNSLRFDLAEAKLALPKMVQAIDNGGPAETTVVRFSFSQQADVRTFREDSNFVVDVSPVDVAPSQASKPSPLAGKTAPPALAEKPEGQAAMPPAPSAGGPGVAAKPEAAAAPPDPDKGPAVAPGQPPAAVAAQDAQPAATPERAPRRDPTRPAIAELRRHRDNLHLFFPFAAPPPAAVFQRADTLWLVFDSAVDIDVGVLASDPSRTIRSASAKRDGDAAGRSRSARRFKPRPGRLRSSAISRVTNARASPSRSRTRASRTG